jgi:hypothetical protein
VVEAVVMAVVLFAVDLTASSALADRTTGGERTDSGDDDDAAEADVR